ncbi:MAG: (Fe-S)-binding protein [Candidatus Helarchaeota archaeon]
MVVSKKLEIIMDLQDISKCYSCGKCTSVCPLSEISEFTPRLIAESWILDIDKEEVVSDIWECLTCARCYSICPMNVNFPEFIRMARTEFIKNGMEFEEAHFGIFSNIARLQTDEKLVGRSRHEIFDGLEIVDKGEILYWVGCSPFFDIVMDREYTNIPRNTVKILNHLGITPVILKNEKCCGHDILWNGDFDNFKKLAEINIKAIEESGAKIVITTCAECYRTLKYDYPRLIGPINFEVISFAEFIESKIRSNQLTFSYEFHYKITYHDPCRLGRHMKVYEAPRNVLKSIPGIEFIEMPRNREDALCCGVSNWHCNLQTKLIRIDRLKEADNTADIVITTCPKCKIHFDCLLNEKDNENIEKFNVKVMDFSTILAKALFLI